MKKFNINNVGRLISNVSFPLLILLAGCAHRQSPTDVRQCCDRVSAHTKEMDKFNRYCKVALFLANSENEKEVGTGIKKVARDGVNVCKFVFGVETDQDLLAAGDMQDYYKIRHYIISSPDTPNGWDPPNCNPTEVHCEEF